MWIAAAAGGRSIKKSMLAPFLYEPQLPKGKREKAAQTDGGGATGVRLCVFYDIRESSAQSGNNEPYDHTDKGKEK